MPQTVGEAAPYGLNLQRSYPLVYRPMSAEAPFWTASYTVSEGEYLRLVEVQAITVGGKGAAQSLLAELKILLPAQPQVVYYAPPVDGAEEAMSAYFGSYITASNQVSGTFTERPIPSLFLPPATVINFDPVMSPAGITSTAAFISGDVYAWDGSGDDPAAAAAPTPAPPLIA